MKNIQLGITENLVSIVIFMPKRIIQSQGLAGRTILKEGTPGCFGESKNRNAKLVKKQSEIIEKEIHGTIFRKKNLTFFAKTEKLFYLKIAFLKPFAT